MADLDPGVVQSVINSNFKSIGEQPALIANAMSMSMQAHNNATNLIREAVLMEALGQRAGQDPSEAVSVARTLEGTLSGLTAQMAMVVSAIQGMSKTVGNIPPVTP